VLLSTVHRIKGKEWDRVIVFGATQGLLPHRLGDDEEGERRVFHVALTRARHQVAVLADAARAEGLEF
jgi:DNA helicase-2/ATP-dependent DNA helicase PcrA